MPNKQFMTIDFTLTSTPVRYFLCVARLGSISAAAEELHIAGSAISRQLARLEESLQMPLFERKPRGMGLTPAGLQLANQLRTTAQQLERTVIQIKGKNNANFEAIRLACTEGFSPGFVPRVIHDFRALYPECQFQLMVQEPEQVSQMLLRGQVDVALKYSLSSTEQGLQSHHSIIAPLHAVMLPDHPLAKRSQLRLRDVVKYPLLMASTGKTGRLLFDLGCSLQELTYKAVVESNSSAALLPLLHGHDLMLAGHLTVSHLLEKAMLVAIPFAEGELQLRRLQLLTTEETHLKPVLQSFIDFMISHMNQSRFVLDQK